MGGLALPLALASLPPTRTIPWIVLASAFVVAGMWLKRFLIVVPGLATPIVPVEWAPYHPSLVEIAVTVGATAFVPLLLMLFFRVFPIISVYEMDEMAEAQGEEPTEGHVAEAW